MIAVDWQAQMEAISARAAGLAAQELRRNLTFLETAFPQARAEPRWAHDAEVLPLRDTLQLRVYMSGRRAPGSDGPESARDGPPTGKGRDTVLIVTPQVNHSYIADFAPDQSLVKTLLDGGAGRVAVTDWLAPPRDRDYGILDSIEDLEAALDVLEGPVHLVGLCQGGWQSAILAARTPACARSLTVAAAPIDPLAGHTPLHLFTRWLPMSWYEDLVKSSGGVAPGRALAMGFDMLVPFERFYGAYARLWLHALDPSYVSRYERLRNWYRLNKDIPGRLYLEVVRDLFKGGKLARGSLKLGGQAVDLGQITCPIHLVAGTRDHITPPPQVRALEGLAPRAARCRYHAVDAGHVGVFMGRRALRTVWPVIAQDLFRGAGG